MQILGGVQASVLEIVEVGAIEVCQVGELGGRQGTGLFVSFAQVSQRGRLHLGPHQFVEGHRHLLDQARFVGHMPEKSQVMPFAADQAADGHHPAERPDGLVGSRG